MSKKSAGISLIVNADDFNLTPGVSRGILQAHDQGIVTSTTSFATLPFSAALVREVKKRKKLGVGIHLNITFGKPLSAARDVPSLVDEKGLFRRKPDLDGISRVELMREYEKQLERFKKIFGDWPTHLDTHHHLHDHARVFEVVRQLAYRLGRPVRSSKSLDAFTRGLFARAGIGLTKYLIEDLSPVDAWSEQTLLKALTRVKPGVNELMCHPAQCDAKLRRISSFNETRERELRALCAAAVTRLVKKKRVRLISFRDLY